DGGADPTARLDRHRTVTAGTFAETLVLSSAAAKTRTTLTLRVAVDLAPMDDVRSGRPDLAPIAVGITETGELHWSGDGVDVVLIAPGAQVTIEDPEHPVLTWDVEAGPDRPAEVSYRLSAS